jgi:hypothetical protein
MMRSKVPGDWAIAPLQVQVKSHPPLGFISCIASRLIRSYLMMQASKQALIER